MRRAALAIVSTVAGLVMLLSFKSHAATTPATPPAAVSGTTGTSGTSSGSSSSSSSGASSSASTSTKTVTGSAVDTRYGPVQVRITVKNGKIVSATAVEYPRNSSRDAEINSYAVPQLDAEAAQAGDANIDMVSGATYTSTGYIQSLQSALNKA